jgi:hypothetical protein
MIRNLSSMWTFYMKVLLPTVWISGFGIGTVLLFLEGGDALGQRGDPPPLR